MNQEFSKIKDIVPKLVITIRGHIFFLLNFLRNILLISTALLCLCCLLRLVNC